MPQPVHVVGGGLAGSEAAWQLARRGVPVVLHEMRPVRGTEAHQTDRLAELVCSNSFRSDDAHGQRGRPAARGDAPAGLAVLAMGDRHKLPAGGALAVDRDGFAAAVTEALEAEPLVTIVREEVTGLPPRGLGRAPSSPPARSPRRRWPRTSAASAARTSSPSSTPSRPIVHREIDRPRDRLVPVALRQGRAGRRHGRLHQLPAGPRRSTTPSSTPCWPARRAEFKDWETEHALFRGLPADRGDGRARPRRRCASGR